MLTARTALTILGQPVTVQLATGSDPLTMSAIVSRDSAKIVPPGNEDGFYEILDAATGQFRTKVDLGYADGREIGLGFDLLGATITTDDEAYVVEYVEERDKYLVKTFCRRSV